MRLVFRIYREEEGFVFSRTKRGGTRSVASGKKDDTEVVPPSTDPINRFQYLSEAYEATDPKFDGRVTVPVLWDKEKEKIVNNCEDDICIMFNNAFNAVARNKDVDLFPKDIEAEHTELAGYIYDNVNNGVYKAGFATRQRPYEISCRKIFEALDDL